RLGSPRWRKHDLSGHRVEPRRTCPPECSALSAQHWAWLHCSPACCPCTDRSDAMRDTAQPFWRGRVHKRGANTLLTTHAIRSTRSLARQAGRTEGPLSPVRGYGTAERAYYFRSREREVQNLLDAWRPLKVRAAERVAEGVAAAAAPLAGQLAQLHATLQVSGR